MTILAKLLKALNSEASPWQIAFAIMFGMLLGLTPTLRLFGVVILLLVLVLRVNLAAFLASFAVFTILAFLLDPLMASVGDALLTSASLQSTWTAMYNSDFWRLTQFNHSLTLGSIVIGLCLAPFIAIGAKIGVVQYRERAMKWVNKLHVVQMVKTSKFYSIYQSVGG
ncbi:TIGR03546 family protein [Bowmanella sp. JS7-9]|uniref:TIGR03546 family protein n=1 Tax=Pseudobowmanella zhangzhouensis TaxID=1537679 RepID=A0ABW1XJD2_9ALTE|nr:TIGR03546 family protein [Bowmanella sp. JS7-9]TBX24565.1 membrane protein [Bowmanella sp. JS7-9]